MIRSETSVWCEFIVDFSHSAGGRLVPIRIFKSFNEAVKSATSYANWWTKAEATEVIRRLVFKRDGWKCTHCGTAVTWNSGELHERKWRSRGGDVSVDNSVTLCKDCHRNSKTAGHGKRRPQWSS